jgi:serine/threonine protein phosphatase PrpC
MPEIRIAYLTHQGRVRDHHEDSIAVGPRILTEPMNATGEARFSLGAPVVAMVADGMGGHPAGEVASRMAIEHLVAAFARAEGTTPDVGALLLAANALLFEDMAEHPERRAMGTTVAGLRIDANRILAYNVGDSRIYRTDGDALVQLSIDDTPRRPPAFAGLAFRTGELTQCLGGTYARTRIDPHLFEEPLVPGRTYLICSDGLYDMVPDRVVRECIDDQLAPSVDRLFERAMRAGGEDNISVILLRTG